MRRDGTTQSRETGGVLAYAAEKLWRTPTSQSENALRGNGMAAETAQRRVDNGHAVNLQDQVTLWYTPNVPNGGRTLSENTSPTGITAGGIKRQVEQENQARWWSTPSASVANDGETPATWNARAALLKEKHRNGNGVGKPLTIQSQEIGDILSSRLHPMLYRVGQVSSPECRSLNPRFVEWLMGWPPGWTYFACSATELSRFKRRMRSALSALALPAEATPAQLALFR
jgi:hypothetical protein